MLSDRIKSEIKKFLDMMENHFIASGKAKKEDEFKKIKSESIKLIN